MTTNDPIPDKEQLSRFVAAIFKHANRAGLVLLQAYPVGLRFDELLFAEIVAGLLFQTENIKVGKKRRGPNW